MTTAPQSPETSAASETRELAELRAAARASAESKQSFLAHLGNVLATPLHAVLGNLELIDATSLSADDRARLDTVNAAAAELATTLEGLMELAAAEGRPFAPKMEARSVGEVLDSIDHRWRRRLAHGGQLLVTQWDDDEATIVADWARLDAVGDRLLDNVQHHAGRGTVTVTINHADGMLTLTVADPGPGFPPEHRDDVLLPFFRVDTAPGSAKGGAGIGLAVADRLVQAVGGSLRIDPSPHGTVATAAMPRERRSRSRDDAD